MTLSSRGKSFVHAFHGLWELFREPNARLHGVAAIIVIIAGAVRHITCMQWVAIILAIGLVLVTEALNTCVEKLCDFDCDGKRHPAIKIIKDISAAAVLIAAMISVTIGIIVFFC